MNRRKIWDAVTLAFFLSCTAWAFIDTFGIARGIGFTLAYSLLIPRENLQA